MKGGGKMELKNGGEDSRLDVCFYPIASNKRAEHGALAGEVGVQVCGDDILRSVIIVSPAEAIAMIIEFTKRYPKAEVKLISIDGQDPNPDSVENNIRLMLETSEESIARVHKELRSKK